MTTLARKINDASAVSTIALISLLIMSSLLASCFSQSCFRVNLSSTVNSESKHPSLPIFLRGINETNSPKATDSNYNYSSVLPDAAPISLNSSNFTIDDPSNQNQLSFSFFNNMFSLQMAEINADLTISMININETSSLNAANSFNYEPSTTLNTSLISLYNTNFTTYTYGGYPVQNPDPTQVCFSFPDHTNQGQIAGSDAISCDTYSIEEINFDTVFITPKIDALGFDEMVIFAASNTITYKGTEFGIRMDLGNGFIYGYIQEPNGNSGEVNFQVLNLTANDGVMHHYTLTVVGSQISFCIDGINCGNLNFSGNNDYSTLSFSVCAVVHRFSDNWDSNGDNMIAGNFTLS